MDHTCTTCHRGCGCSLTDPGCGHYGCFGRWADRSCLGAAAEETRYAAALREARARDLCIRVRHGNLEGMHAAFLRSL